MMFLPEIQASFSFTKSYTYLSFIVLSMWLSSIVMAIYLKKTKKQDDDTKLPACAGLV